MTKEIPKGQAPVTSFEEFSARRDAMETDQSSGRPLNTRKPFFGRRVLRPGVSSVTDIARARSICDPREPISPDIGYLYTDADVSLKPTNPAKRP